MNVYDFDGTIYKGDSTIDFYLYALKTNPKLACCLPKQLLGIAKYILKKMNASDDENQKYRGVTIYDIDMDKKTATYSDRILHNLGHVNSIDYCNSTDLLILGNESDSSTLSGEIYILQNLTNRVSWELDDGAYTVIESWTAD